MKGLLRFDFDIAFNYRLRQEKDKAEEEREQENNRFGRAGSGKFRTFSPGKSSKNIKSAGSLKDYIKSGGFSNNRYIKVDPKVFNNGKAG